MAQESPPSEEAVRAKREEFEDSLRELISELERLLPSVPDQKKTLWKRRKKFNAFKNQLTKKLERCKKLRLKALKEILPDLIKKLKSNSFSKFEIIDDVAKLWTVLNKLEQDPSVSPSDKCTGAAVCSWVSSAPFVWD